MKLIIVESPHKSVTIGKFLGKGYKVLASKGHICDLAANGKMGLGVDVENDFAPRYVISKDKEGVVRELKNAVSKADEVYLATDPDREGEAIAYHLARILKLDLETTKRLEFHEVTKTALDRALENPRTIDLRLVKSQETRRIIDRIMGFRLSNILQKKIKSRSAGRVQSVVLRFVVDREKEIQAFVPVEYWTMTALFSNDRSTVKAELSSYQGKPVKIGTKEQAETIERELPAEFVVSSIKNEIKTREPKPPFITSTLQQEAFSQFHFSTKKTATIAQRLYEGVEIDGVPTGLITYMRTDSTRLSDEFKGMASRFIEESFGKEYLGRAHMQKSSKNVQDAHEAIRPTDVRLTPSRVKDSLNKDEFQLYSLIYERALASLMAGRKDSITTISFTGNDYVFTTSGSINVFDGYTKIYGKYEEKESKVQLPSLIQGETMKKESIEKLQHFTKAPARYNEGKLVKMMQENGIGRPSTYAPTITNLLDHDYIENQKGSLLPTEQGDLTVEKLTAYFPKYMDVSYTAQMETDLDEIAEGKIDEQKLLSSFWNEFKELYANAEEKMEKIPPKEVGRACPKCGAPLVLRKGKYGEFVGCSRYPDCDYIEKPKPEVVEGKVCPRCGKPLVKRSGKKGEFVGCSDFPRCTYMETLDGTPIVTEKKEVVIPEDAPLCPRCHTGHLIEKKSRWGKTFIACSNYPKCRYIPKDEKKAKKEK